MKYSFFFVIFLSLNVQASPPIEATKLDEQLAAELGFKVDQTKDKYGLTIELRGPATFGDSCTPLAAGHFVVQGDKEISAFINSAHPESPESVSFLSDSTVANLVVFIDYQCQNESKRFTVSSSD